MVTGMVLGATAAALGGPVGLLAAAGAATAVGGVATHHLVQNYEQLKKAFQKQHATLNELTIKGSEMQESAGEVQRTLEGLALVVDGIEHSQQNPENVESLCHHLGQLHTNFELWSDVSSQCRSTIKEKKQVLRRRIQIVLT